MENLSFGTNGESENGLPRESRFQEYLSMILRGKWTIIISFLLVTAATTIFTLKTKPIYEASSLVLIDMQGKSGQLTLFDLTGGSNFNKITNETEILKSRSMAEAVADALLKQERFDGPLSPVIPVLQIIVDDVPQKKLASVPVVASRVLGMVKFTPIRDSDLIKIIAQSTDAREAALLANTYTKVYTERNLNTSRTRSRAVREFLEDQLGTRKTALDTAESALQEYMKRSGMVSLDGESNKVVQQLSQLEAGRDAIEVDMRSRAKALSSYKEEVAKQEPSVAKTLGESSDAYIKMLQEKLATLEVQRDVVIAQNPGLAGQSLYSEKLKEIDSQIASLKKNLQGRTQQFLKSIGPGGEGGGVGSAAFIGQIKQKVVEQQIELEALDAKKRAMSAVIGQYEKQFNQIPEKSIELAKLQRARLSNEKLYLLVEEKFNEAAITEKSEFGYVDIVDPAIVPTRPVSPDLRKNIMLGALVGLALGMALVLLRSYVDVRIRTPEDLKRFGYVPLSAINQMTEEMQKDEGSANGNGHPIDNGFNPRLVTYFNPLSPLAEAYRRLRTNVLYAQMEKPLKSFLVTSPNPSEGKSTTIANLAIAFAQAEKKVLLVDGDMRRPTIHNHFNISKNPGLTDLFVGTSSFDEVVNKNVVENLDILCCGTTPPNPAELLGSKRMQDFVRQMSEKYDLIMFDSPPLLAVTDAAVLSTGVDGAILVVSAGTTRAASIHRASEFLTTVGGKALGVVLNNFDVKKAYGGYYGSYSYGYYGYGYGYYRSKEDSDAGKKGSKRKKMKIGKG